jgi:hypothetical protein
MTTIATGGERFASGLLQTGSAADECALTVSLSHD